MSDLCVGDSMVCLLDVVATAAAFADDSSHGIIPDPAAHLS